MHPRHRPDPSRTRSYRDNYLAAFAGEGLRAPDEVADTYAIWTNDETKVLVRFSARGTLELDAYWTEHDGRPNRLFAPHRYDFIPHLARDIGRILADPTAIRTLGNAYRPDRV